MFKLPWTLYTRESMERIKKLVAFVLIASIVCFFAENVSYAKAKEADNNSINYNIEVVVDASGSLKKSDSEGNRFTAIDIFLQTLREKGNNAGAVVFTQKIDVDTGLSDMDSKKTKEDLSKKMKSIKADKGDTNIGLALETAVNRLQRADNGLENIVLLISDGNTDLGSDSENKKSLKKEEKAIQKCITEGIKVFGICLNHDNSADVKEFKDISSRTNGEFLEVKNSENLVEALKDFYAKMFNTKFNSDTKKIGENGIVTKAIEVPSYGVEELNITINNASKTSKITLTKPNGVDLSKNEFKGISSKIDDYYFLKITSPDAGTWKVIVNGKKDTKITFDYVFNTDNKVGITTNSENNSVSVNEDVEINASFYGNGSKLTGKKYYQGYSGTLVVGTSKSEKKDLQYYPMEMDGENGFKCNLSYDKEGTYKVYAVLSCGEFESKSDTVSFSVGNKLPVFSSGEKEYVTIKVKKIFGGKKEIPVDKYFKDSEDKELTYSLMGSSYDSDQIVLEDSSITLFDLKNGKFVIEAKDSNGGTVKGTFRIEVQSYLFIVIGAVALVVLVIILIIFINVRNAKNRFFDGYLNVLSNSEVDDSNSRPMAAFKGKVNLADLGLMGHQFGNDMCFKVLKDNSIKGDASHLLQLTSSKPFYYKGPQGEQKLTKLNLVLNMSYDIRSHSIDDYDAINDAICISLDSM